MSFMYRILQNALLAVICLLYFAAAALASPAKEEAKDYLRQAAAATAEADNLAYSVSMAMTGPLADFSVTADGVYNRPFGLSGRIGGAVDLWIIDQKMKISGDYYAETDRENKEFIVYSKLNPVPDGAVQNALAGSNPLKMNQWYVQKFPASDEMLAEMKAQRRESLDSLTDDLKNIFMYNRGDGTVKIYASYNVPLLRESEITQMMQADKNDPAVLQPQKELKELLRENPALYKALIKPHSLTYEITVDDDSHQIKSISADMSEYIQKAGSDVLDAIPFEQLEASAKTPAAADKISLRSIAKNYLKRSTVTMEMHLSDINSAGQVSVPQAVKDSAIEPPQDESYAGAENKTEGSSGIE